MEIHILVRYNIQVLTMMLHLRDCICIDKSGNIGVK